MPYQPDKLRNRHYVAFNVESTYGDHTAATTLTDGTLGLFTRAQPSVSPAYAFDGNLEGEGSPGGATRPYIAPTGRWGTLECETYFRSPTATYASGVIPDVLKAARGHGLSATFNATGGPGSTPLWTLAPQRSSFTSLGIDVYGDGEVDVFGGFFWDQIAIDFAAGQVPVWKLRGQGIRPVVEADAAWPGQGYNAFSANYAKFVTTSGGAPAMSITSGSETAHLYVRSGTWTSTRPIEPLSSSSEQSESGLGHSGFTLGNEVATFEGVVSARTRHTSSPYIQATNHRFDPTRLLELARTFAVVLQSGTMTGQHGFKIAGATCCLTRPATREGNGSEALWNIAIQFNASGDSLNDAYAITAS